MLRNGVLGAGVMGISDVGVTAVIDINLTVVLFYGDTLHRPLAVRTAQQTREQVHIAGFQHGLGSQLHQLLHTVKGVLVDNRFVGVLNNNPICLINLHPLRIFCS